MTEVVSAPSLSVEGYTVYDGKHITPFGSQIERFLRITRQIDQALAGSSQAEYLVLDLYTGTEDFNNPFWDNAHEPGFEEKVLSWSEQVTSYQKQHIYPEVKTPPLTPDKLVKRRHLSESTNGPIKRRKILRGYDATGALKLFTPTDPNFKREIK